MIWSRTGSKRRVSRRRAAIGVPATVLALLASAAVAAPASAVPDPATTAAPAMPGPERTGAATPAERALAVNVLAEQAAKLQAQVDSLRIETARATERYNEVKAALAAAEQAQRRAAEVLAFARVTERAAQRAAEDRIRALYINGGGPGLTTFELDAGSVRDTLAGMQDARSIIEDDQARIAAAVSATQAARKAEATMAAATARQRRLASEAASAADAVRAKLAETTALLQSASADVQALLRERDRTEQRTSEQLAELVRTVQLTTGRSGVALDGSAVNAVLEKVLAAAHAQLGKPYLWGATGPSSFDCSGFTQYAFAAGGVTLPRTSRQQWYAGSHPELSEARPGDLLFWGTPGASPESIHHMSIYLGNGYMIVAPHSGAVVRIQKVYASGFYGVTRVLG